MDKRKIVDTYLEQHEESSLFADGLDAAIVGVGRQFSHPPVVVYDYHRVIEILMQRDKMSYEEAVEFFSFNIIGAWVGEQTPIFIHRIENLEGEIS
jgi:hypothetical protein